MSDLMWFCTGDDKWNGVGHRFSATVAFGGPLGWVASWEGLDEHGKSAMLGGALRRVSREDAISCTQECFDRFLAAQLKRTN